MYLRVVYKYNNKLSARSKLFLHEIRVMMHNPMYVMEFSSYRFNQDMYKDFYE